MNWKREIHYTVFFIELTEAICVMMERAYNELGLRDT